MSMIAILGSGLSSGRAAVDEKPRSPGVFTCGTRAPVLARARPPAISPRPAAAPSPRPGPVFLLPFLLSSPTTTPMPPLATLARTGAFAWGTSAAHLPILATGTASGALDDSFDQGGRLELWSVYGADPSLPSPSTSSEAPQSPVAAKKKASARKESIAAGAADDSLDFGEEGDDEDGFLAEVSTTGHGEAGKREPVRSFKVKSRYVQPSGCGRIG
jgi:hypothetical protein